MPKRAGKKQVARKVRNIKRAVKAQKKTVKKRKGKK